MDLNEKGVVVAGGAGSIGTPLVARLRERGARVVVLDAAPAADVKFADPEIVYVQADVADESAMAVALAAAVDRLGKIHALVNCTGLIHSEVLVNLTRQRRRHEVATWDAVIRSNLTATFVASLYVAEHMVTTRTKGVIVNFSSVAASGNPGQTAYAAAKAGVEAMTAVWAREFGPLGIRAVAVAPGFVDTASTLAALGPDASAEWRRRTPLRRLGHVEEIVSAVLFALENDFVTGRTIHVDGGLTI